MKTIISLTFFAMAISLACFLKLKLLITGIGLYTILSLIICLSFIAGYLSDKEELIKLKDNINSKIKEMFKRPTINEHIELLVPPV